MNKTVITSSATETQKVGKEFGQQLLPGDCVLLYGNLGAGKTTFVQGMAQGLEITKRIISPTFVIVRSYEIKKGMFYHVDLYRIETKHDAEGTGLFDILKNEKSIVAIEWPEKLDGLLPFKRWEVVCNYVDEQHRSISITKRD